MNPACRFAHAGYLLLYSQEFHRGIKDIGFVGAPFCAERRRRQVSNRTVESFAYCSASFCPSNTAGWQVWFIADRAAHMRAANPALAIGPAISRSSIVPGF